MKKIEIFFKSHLTIDVAVFIVFFWLQFFLC